MACNNCKRSHWFASSICATEFVLTIAVERGEMTVEEATAYAEQFDGEDNRFWAAISQAIDIVKEASTAAKQGQR